MKGTTSFPDRGSYELDQIRVSFCLLCCLDLLGFVFFLCHLVLFVSTLVKLIVLEDLLS